MSKVVFLFLILITSDTFALSSEEILKKIDQIRAPGDTFVFDLKITYKKEGKEDIIQKFAVRVKDADKSLVKFTYPANNKGRLFLMVGNNMWIYIPDTRRPIRISPQQRLLGQISNGDVARVVYSLDYNAKLLEKEKIAEREYIKLELTAKTKEATYSKILLWTDTENFEPQKAEFYTVSGKMLKTAFYKGYANVLGRKRPLIMEIHDELCKGEYSIIEYSNMKVDDTPKAFFQKTYLKHIR
ncbi:outer membrane lipoprotein-sorting protein [bacterium]|nr:outer membrane lipoprotein-sorting protein [bacterium]MBU1753929.1 outer membrane lipoprotein-sorting protein [bacterium]